MLVGKGGPGTDGEAGVRLGVVLVVVDEGQVVVVSVVVRVRVVAAAAGEEGNGSSVWGRGRAVVVGRRSEARRRLREERIESRDIVVVVFPGFRPSS